MKPAPFEYAAADTVEEAVTLLAEHGDEAKALAGGQSLVPLLNLRLARPAFLVDLNPIRGLAEIGANGSLTLGALTRQADALASLEVARRAPLLAEGLRHVGHPATRNRGTVGGSVAHADPAAELPAILAALDAEIAVRGPNGERTVPAAELFLGPFTTALAPDELLTEIRVPAGSDARRFGFHELARRRGDFALAGAAVLLEPARIVLFGVGGTPLRSLDAERALDEGAGAEEVAALATAELDPPSDVHAPGAYRRRAAAVALRRALAQAGVTAGA